MSHTIQHIGTVERVVGDVVYVAVEQQSACAGCHAKGLCGTSGEHRVIEVRTSEAAEYVAGDRVRIALESGSMGFSSVAYGYVLPLIVLLVVLFGAKSLDMTDGVAAISTLVALAIYYVALYVLRRMFERKIIFTIIKE